MIVKREFSSDQKTIYTQGWLKRHCRGQKTRQGSLRSQGRVSHIRVLHFLSPSLQSITEIHWLLVLFHWSQAELHQLRIWPLTFNGRCQLKFAHEKKKKMPRLNLSQDDQRGHKAFRIINSYQYNNPFYDTIKLHGAFQDIDKLHSLCRRATSLTKCIELPVSVNLCPSSSPTPGSYLLIKPSMRRVLQLCNLESPLHSSTTKASRDVERSYILSGFSRLKVKTKIYVSFVAPWGYNCCFSVLQGCVGCGGRREVGLFWEIRTENIFAPCFPMR